MTKVINSTAELPVEFNIEKYGPSAAFQLQEWASNVCFRTSEAHLTDFFLDCVNDVNNATEDIAHSHSLALTKWMKLVESPLRPVEDPNHLAITGPLRERAVGDVDMLDYVLIRPQWGDRLPDDPDPVEKYQRLLDVWDGRECDSYPPAEREEAHRTLTTTPYWKVVGARGDGTNTIAFNGSAMVKVDLHATDEKLAADFMLWVRETRAELGVSGRTRLFKDRDFERWHRTRVLAYFDLSFWAKLVDAKITDYAMGLALFPDDLDVTNPADRVRQTVRPMVEELFSVPVSTALANQAMEEIRH
jgi:hypothetical protein